MIRYIILYSLLLICAEAKASCLKEHFSVAIDIGHTKKSPGAMSARGVHEYYFNADIAMQFYEILQNNNFKKAFIINRDGAEISLSDRAKIANEQKADVFISIHHDSVQPHYLSSWDYEGKHYQYSDRFQGYSIFYSEKNANPDDSFIFGRFLGDELLKNGFTPTLHHAEQIKGENRELIDKAKGIYQFNDLVVLKTVRMPAILLECGIIVNREEEILLRNRSYQKMLIFSLAASIERFCEFSQNKSE